MTKAGLLVDAAASGMSWSNPLQVSGFTPGGAAASASLNAPRQPSLRQAFAGIVQSEGVRALWKGNGATVIHRSVTLSGPFACACGGYLQTSNAPLVIFVY